MAKKREKSKKPKRRARATSSLADHHRNGGQLRPPFARLPRVALASWPNERLPEMVWAALLVSELEREHALAIFRHVAAGGEAFRDRQGNFDITHSGLEALPNEHPTRMIGRICDDPLARRALVPLLLLDELPAKDLWREALGTSESTPDWRPLMGAVAKTLFHQSEEATDCRWLRVLFPMATGKQFFLRGLEETARGILGYPHYGNLAKVRASIRAMETAMDRLAQPSSEWPARFWRQCFRDTPCFEPSEEQPSTMPSVGTSRERVREVRTNVIDHFFDSLEATAVDPRHDTTFGIALFALGTLDELLGIGAAASIWGRFALRCLLECFITLAYLAKRDDPELWKSHRVYGSGQAKLALLKLEEDSIRPEYVSIDTLQELANEDLWQEYLNINLGHWDKTNLRKMAEDAKVKEVYDRYYPWTSSYVHGHWASIRDACFQTCLNPLHRMHRVPRRETPMLHDVIPDACSLTDKILDLLHALYPEFHDRLTVGLRSNRGSL